MRNIWCIILVVCALSVSAQAPEDFFSLVDFEASVVTISERVAEGRFDLIDSDRYFLLEGTVGSVQVLNPEPASYEAVVELVSGLWRDVTRLEEHRIYLYVQGEEFAGRFASFSRDAGPTTVQTNQDILAVGRFIGTAVGADGEELAVIQLVAVR
ncbi:MAG: hypothetical protein ACLFNT_03610 [Spirochaetales bacterium]